MIHVEGRRGDWITIQSGVKFWPLDAKPEEIKIEDIAHALSNVCRFGGHTREFYSVAQHCVLVSRLGILPLEKRWGLLHDAAEAYVGDVIRPIKRCVPEFKRAEVELERAIAVKFGLPWPMPEVIKTHDLTILACEARDLMPPNCGGTWNIPLRPDPEIKVDPWGPKKARRVFMEEFEILFPEA